MNLRPIRAAKIFYHSVAIDLQLQVVPGAHSAHPVRERSPFDSVACELTVLVDGISPEKTDAPRHRCPVFLIGAFATNVGSKRRHAWIREYFDKRQLWREDEPTMRIGAISIRSTALALNGCTDHAPCPNHGIFFARKRCGERREGNDCYDRQ
ncbi:hypothetical protein D3C84_834470 [compost metagenome]